MTEARNKLILAVAFLAAAPFAKADGFKPNNTDISIAEQRLLDDFEYSMFADHSGNMSYDEWLESMAQQQTLDGVSDELSSRFSLCTRVTNTAIPADEIRLDGSSPEQTAHSEQLYTRAQTLFLNCINS